MARMLDRVGAALGLSFVLAFSGGMVGCGGGKADTKTPASEGGGNQLSVGSTAPDLSIQTINGKGKISNDSLKGKVAVVDFWATWCAPCKTSFPKLEELAKKHAGRVEVVGVACDDENTNVASFAKENGATFAIGWDDGHAIAKRWKVESMPTTVILDASGNVRHVHAGFHDDEPEKIAKELTALLAEPAPAASPKTEVASASPPSSPPAEEKKEETAKKEEEADPPAPPKKSGKKAAPHGKKAGKKKK
jgi:cytochrome c biogenesis protein CcmG, thiol:disulfide interchange protein DsbE